jgi:hypothetical protein
MWPSAGSDTGSETKLANSPQEAWNEDKTDENCVSWVYEQRTGLLGTSMSICKGGWMIGVWFGRGRICHNLSILN